MWALRPRLALLCFPSGVDFLWRVYLQHPLHKVAHTAMDSLILSYKEGWAGLDVHVFVG
jgi:hypothetical protein